MQENGTRTLPEGWRWVRLGEVIRETRNGIYKPAALYGTGTPILKMFNLGRLDGTWNLERVDRVMLDPTEEESFRLLPGDLLFNRVNSRELVGKCAVVTDAVAGSVFESKNIRIRLDEGSVAPGFVAAWLNSDAGRRRIDSRLKQIAGQATLNKRDITGLVVPLPPLPEQRRIVTTLSERMGMVRQARTAAAAQLNAAAALRAAYLRDAFHGIVPLAVDRGRGHAPAGWRWRKLHDVARLESGHTPSRRHPEWWGGEIPWIALPDIRALDGRVATETLEYTNDGGIANSSARVLPAGTVVLSRTASVGFVTLMGRPMATSQDFVNWVCGPSLDPLFLMYLLQAAREYIRGLASGAVHKTVYMPTVKDFQVCIPPVAEQVRIAEELRGRFERVDELQTDLEAQRADIEALPAALLRQAFAGEL